MAKQASKTVIGGFVIGALVLVVAGVVVFGSGKFFTVKRKYVAYFDGSVKGLNVGASVSFRGVKIGSVTDIQMVVDPDKMTAQIPVFFEIEPSRFSVIGHDFAYRKAMSKEEQEKSYREMVKHGLRAQLQTESLVTGQSMVGLDFHPDKPARLVGDGTVPEIPTIPSSMQELTKTIQNIPLDRVVNELMETIAAIKAFVQSEAFMAIPASLNRTVEDIDKLVQRVDMNREPLASALEETIRDIQKLVRNVEGQVAPLFSSIRGASDAARGALVQAEKTLALEEGVPGALASSLKGALDEARAAMTRAKGALATAEGMIAEESPLRYELNNTLAELSAASRSIRVFADYLERHPEALIQGKGGPGGQ